MRAIVCPRYGPPETLELRNIDKPLPRAGQVLARVAATTVNSADWRIRSLSMPRGFGPLARPIFGLRKPRRPILGTELAGVVESVGAGVNRFKPGDRVFAFTGVRMGCHAEYVCLSQDAKLLPIPANLSHEEAASLSFGGTTALHFLRRAALKPGQSILINGASGCVGSAAVQIARHLGADVTAVCSGANAPRVAALGARRVIDHTTADFARQAITYDVVFDTVGNVNPARARGVMHKDSRLVLIAADLPDMLRVLATTISHRGRFIVGPAAERMEDLKQLAELAEAGAYKPMIDRVYPFEQFIAAHHRVASGRKRGSVVLALNPA